MKRIAVLSTLVLLLHAGLCVIAGIFVADGALHPARRPLDAEERAYAVKTAEQAGSELQDVSLMEPDRTDLKGWLIRPVIDNGNAVILLHGLSDNRGGVIGHAELLLAAGYSVLMPDARAHGESGGALATYGLLEREDIHQWVTWLEDRTHPQCVFGFGESMGAAQLLQSLAVERRFCAVAVESPFSDFRQIAYDRMGQTFGVGPWLGETLLRPIVEIAFLRAEQKYGLRLQQVSPERVLVESQVPVLLIHGANDHNILPRHSERILQARPIDTEIWRVAGADHCGAISTSPKEFALRLLSFYAEHSSQEAR
ncbi:MAG: alpha/beta fold hydrolase [Acidobacteriia bacterium]|nr:alpha/beta fold hydrolase [Terriglobia bacterium]